MVARKGKAPSKMAKKESGAYLDILPTSKASKKGGLNRKRGRK